MIKFCIASGIISNKFEKIFNLLYLESGSLSKTDKLCFNKSLSSIISEDLVKACKLKIISLANLSIQVDKYSITAFKLFAINKSLLIYKKLFTKLRAIS